MKLTFKEGGGEKKMNLVLVDNGSVVGTVENVDSQNLARSEVRESLVQAIENLMAIDVEYTKVIEGGWSQ